MFKMRKKILQNKSNVGFRIAIDASRNRSGGAKAHLVGLISEIDIKQHGITEVHVWSHKDLLRQIEDRPFLIKHRSDKLAKTTFLELFWQRFVLGRELRRYKCDILLNCDAGTVSSFEPCVTMSRDMLSYEEGEMERYGFTKARLRLLLLKFIQNRSLRRANGAIFLTQYAAQKIMSSCGPLNKYVVVPHGVSEQFRLPISCTQHRNRSSIVKLLYVSNVDWYKHQWNVVKATKILRDKGWNLELTLVGGGTGSPMKYLNQIINEVDPGFSFLTLLPFVNHADLPGIMSQNDIFIFASSCENMPNTLIEGMCAGLPILCSDRGPMPEVLRDAGRYFDPEDILSISNSIENFLVDQRLAFEMARKSKALSDQYNWRRCAQETMNFISDVFDLSRKS